MSYSKPRPGDKRYGSVATDAAFFCDAIDAIAAHKSGAHPPGWHGGSGPDLAWVTIRNDTGADLDFGNAVRLGPYLLDGDDPRRKWFEGLAVDTTFSRRYAIAAQPIPDGEMGPAFIRGMCPVRYTGPDPADGDGLGPKPGQATLAIGFPCFAAVDAAVDSTEKLVLATLDAISQILCKATAGLSEGPVSANFQIWQGTIASGSNSGYTGLPSIELQADVDSGDFFIAHWINGGWVSPKGGTGGGGSSILQSTLAADCAIGAATADVTGEGEIANPMGYGGASGSAVFYSEVDGDLKVIGIAIVAVELDKNVADLGSVVVQTKVTAGIHAVSTEGDASDIFTWGGCTISEEE